LTARHPWKNIPLIKPAIGPDEIREVDAVLRSGWLAQGPKVAEFEERISSYLGGKHVIATSSCTAALSLALDAQGLRDRGSAIVPNFTFPATANVVIKANLQPVLSDTSLNSFAIDPFEVEKGVNKGVRAIIPVHPFGHPFEIDEINEIAEKNDAAVIEDAATAFGSKYKGRMVGERGTAVCFSFHPRKLLTTAEGGCLVTSDDQIEGRARALRNHGQGVKDGRPIFTTPGLNYRMSDVHAAIGIAQLRRIDGIIRNRRKQAGLYGELIASSHIDVQPPIEEEWGYHTYQSYVVTLGKSFPPRDSCIQILKKKYRIETQVGTYAISGQPAYKTLARVGSLSNSRMAYRKSLTLPLYDSLSEEQQIYITDALAELIRT
jgi:perosamine synthetase